MYECLKKFIMYSKFCTFVDLSLLNPVSVDGDQEEDRLTR